MPLEAPVIAATNAIELSRRLRVGVRMGS
jgi:hypothetical protein